MGGGVHYPKTAEPRKNIANVITSPSPHNQTNGRKTWFWPVSKTTTLLPIQSFLLTSICPHSQFAWRPSRFKTPTHTLLGGTFSGGRAPIWMRVIDLHAGQAAGQTSRMGSQRTCLASPLVGSVCPGGQPRQRMFGTQTGNEPKTSLWEMGR